MSKEPLVNYLTWSEQRAKTFLTCERQYGFRHLEAWEGWLSDAPEAKRHAYLLNQIVPDLQLITGTIVHDRCGRVMQRLSTGLTSSSLEEEVAIAQEDFDEFLLQSAARPLEKLSAKRKKLLAHLFEEPIPAALIERERTALGTMLGHFFARPEHELFRARPECLLQEFIENTDHGPTHELGVPARLVTDAVYQADGHTFVLDWKTGNEHESHRTKAVIYDIFVRERLRLQSTDSVTVRICYLRSGTDVDFTFTEEERAEARWLVGEDFALLREKSADPVVNVAPLSVFHARLGPHCLRCPHQVLCSDFTNGLTRGHFDRFLK